MKKHLYIRRQLLLLFVFLTCFAGMQYRQAITDHFELLNIGTKSHATLDSEVGANTAASHTQGTDQGLDTGGANAVTAAEAAAAYTHVSEDGTSHSAVTGNTTAIGLNTTHRSSNGVDHAYVKKNVFAETTAPTVNDDTGDGFGVGSFWHDTTADQSYVCLDPVGGAAVWILFSEDATAIHTDESNEIGGLESKINLANGDIFLIEDSANDYAKMKTTLTYIADAVGGGGGGSPGGTNQMNQYNEAGSFGGDPQNLWDPTNNIQTINGASAIYTVSTFPTAAEDGTKFFRQDVKTEFLYEQGWVAIANYGSTTDLYVDPTGTDGAGYGYASGIDAYETIQGLVDDLVPRTYSGVITVNIAAGTYAESVVVAGKTPADSTANIIFLGTLSNQTSGTASAGGASTLTDAGETWTTDQYQYDLLRITGGTGDGQYAWIKSNTNTEIATIYGSWNYNPDATTTYSIDQLGTIVNGSPAFTLDGQTGISFKYIKTTSGSGLVWANNHSKMDLTACKATSTSITSNAIRAANLSVIAASDAVFLDDTNSNGLSLAFGSSTGLIRRWAFRSCGSSAYTAGANIQDNSTALFAKCEWDSCTGQEVKISGSSYVYFYTGGNINILNDLTVGVNTYTWSFGENAVGQTYTGAGTNTQADAYSNNS